MRISETVGIDPVVLALGGGGVSHSECPAHRRGRWSQVGPLPRAEADPGCGGLGVRHCSGTRQRLSEAAEQRAWLGMSKLVGF